MNKLQINLAALALVAGTALAQTPTNVTPRNPLLRPVQTPLSFGSMDTNQDGRVSREEAQTHAELTGAWSTLDADHDTYLSATEFGKWQSPAADSAAGKLPADSSSPQNATDAGSPASKPETASDKQDSSSPQIATEAR